jgi:hypothetical protein
LVIALGLYIKLSAIILSQPALEKILYTFGDHNNMIIPFFLEGVNESTMNDDQLKKKIDEANKFMRHELSHNTKNPLSTQKSGYKSLLSVVDPASMDNKQDDNESILSHWESSPGAIRNVFNV